MPQLLALEVCLGTNSGEDGWMIEGIEPDESAIEALVPSETRPRFFLVTAAPGTAARLAAVGLEGPAAAQKDSAMVGKGNVVVRWL